ARTGTASARGARAPPAGAGGTRPHERLAPQPRDRLAPRLATTAGGARGARARRRHLREHAAARGGGRTTTDDRFLTVRLNGRLTLGARLAEAPGSVDRGAEVQALVLGLLDQHHRLERLDVVDPLLLALGGDLRLVRPVVELHLRDAGDLAHLAEVELDLVQMLREIDRLEKIYLPAYRHWDTLFSFRTWNPSFNG